MEFAFEISWVPIAGAVMAIVGVILDIVALILGSLYPEESPAEKFIKGAGRDFLKTISIDEEATKDKKKKVEGNHDVKKKDVTDEADLPKK